MIRDLLLETYGKYLGGDLVNTVLSKNEVMVHACGKIDGYEYTNSVDALDMSIKKGGRYIEVDLSLTKDERVVCVHKWDKNTFERLGIAYRTEGLSYEEFMNSKYYDNYSTMDLDRIIDYLKKYEDLYMMLDVTKDLDEEDTKKIYELIIKGFEENKKLLDRVVIEGGSIEMFEAINSIFDFPNKHFYLTGKDINEERVDEILEYIKNDGHFVGVSSHKKNVKVDIIRKVHKLGIVYITYPINEPAEALKYFNFGVDIICSSELTKEDLLKEIENMSHEDKVRLFFEKDVFAVDTAGAYIVSISEDEAECAMKVEHKHINGSGIVQGGALFTLADFAFGVLADSKGYPQVSVSNTISYLRPGELGDVLTAVARVVSKGNKICFYKVDIYNQDNKHLATMDVTGYIKNIKILK
ncbi:hotdog fold thioesterase [Anaerofustis stercorihominis]|uniref:Hotdog fold thioesterase n=1 Tax=Anaerofustis stercorihominis TaxID=214853 RepID=A0A3E3DZB3_9FIRM|nr:hotdog fold thioesterase [Anaerofustis stercorihominis]RGD74627.1 hotdog fold thioesterase [Anaerofustis stercorihominis]